MKSKMSCTLGGTPERLKSAQGLAHLVITRYPIAATVMTSALFAYGPARIAFSLAFTHFQSFSTVHRLTPSTSAISGLFMAPKRRSSTMRA